jgi:hypothetical protein
MAKGVAAGFQPSSRRLGPVLFRALARLAAIFFAVAIEVLLLIGDRIGIVAQGTLGFLAEQAAAGFAG